LTGEGLHLLMVSISERASVNLRCHDLRHLFALYMVNVRGIPLPKVQKFKGHSDVSTLMIYAEPTNQMAVDSFARLIANDHKSIEREP